MLKAFTVGLLGHTEPSPSPATSNPGEVGLVSLSLTSLGSVQHRDPCSKGSTAGITKHRGCHGYCGLSKSRVSEKGVPRKGEKGRVRERTKGREVRRQKGVQECGGDRGGQEKPGKWGGRGRGKGHGREGVPRGL